MKVKFFNPGNSYQNLRSEILPEIDRVLKKGDLILRKDVEKFENKLAKYVGTKYAVALNSGTDALYLALRGLGIGKGDRVIVPSRTFVATAQVIVQVGAEPVYYDINGQTYGELYNEDVKAIIPVHIEGAFDKHFKDILKRAKEEKIHVIEDACQALGAEWRGKKAGSFGVAGCFSFYPAKILGACGDAGALVTNNNKMYEYVKDARNHFKENNNNWGINSRMDNLQAAILNVKFKYHKNNLKRREQIAKMYDKDLCNIEDLTLPPSTKGRVWQDYIVRTKNRDELYDFLKSKGIETMKNNYPFPVPKLPLAQEYEDETLRLPCNENLTNKEIEYVIKEVKAFYNQVFKD